MSETELSCPHCAVRLHGADVWPSVIRGCGRCGGIWLDTHACMRLVRSPDPRIVELANRAARNAPAPVSGTEPRQCLQCGVRMAHSAISGVTVDACAQHGTWFDANELQRVVRGVKQKTLPARPPSAPVSEAELAEFRAALKTPSQDAFSLSMDPEEAEGVLWALLGIAFQVLLDSAQAD